MSAFSFVDILLVDSCRSRAAISGAPGSWSRSATCFDYAAKEGVPGKGALSGKGNSPARDGTVDPAATEAAAGDLGAGNPLAQKLSLGSCFFCFSFLEICLIDFPPLFVLQTHLRLSQWRQRAPASEGAVEK